MARRSYDQYCTLAHALDVVGERWTVLIVRELFLGPRRFGELLEGLPGIGRNLLVTRLGHLESEGLVRRRPLGGARRGRAYELTDDGRALGPALTELGRWGVGRLGSPRPGQAFRPAWAMFPLSYTADPEAARGVHETYEFQAGGETFHLRVDDGVVEPRTGPAEERDLLVRMEVDTLLDLFSGAVAAADAVAQGRVELEGSPEALQHALAILAREGQGAPGF